jgi:hypothetical protein
VTERDAAVVTTEPPGDVPAAGRIALLGRLGHLRFVSLGLTGQLLTLAAMVIPILLRRADQVFVLVFT